MSCIFSQVLVLVFCGQLVKPESFSQFNEILLKKRIPLKTIHFPWSMNQTNLNQVLDVIVQVLNSKKCGTVEQDTMKVIFAVPLSTQ
jgi:hypothetical protein